MHSLNDIAITQMRLMLAANNVKSLKLNPTNARKMPSLNRTKTFILPL